MNIEEIKELIEKKQFTKLKEELKEMKSADISTILDELDKEIDKKVQPYIYIGKGDTVEYEGEKPITMKIKLHNDVPSKIYREFIEKV